MSIVALDDLIHFELPDELAAHEPPEARGLERDEVRLLVSDVDADEINHARFTQLPELLERGDVLVVNTSATINASLPAIRAARADSQIRLHLSTQLSPTRWTVELREIMQKGSAPLLDALPEERLLLLGGGEARLLEHWPPGDQRTSGTGARLWVAALELPNGVLEYTRRYGEPIRYAYVRRAWPLSYYQTMFSREPGSAEMPSAGRPLTPRVVAGLTQRGVRIAAITLHTGVSSLETGEPPYPERYRVPQETAVAVNAARRNGGRVIAVGTTVVRALETVASRDGSLRVDEGWTDSVVSPERPPRAVDGIITGLHAPNASHLAMLEAFAGRERLARAYDEALHERYLWHEFGDSHLIAPRRRL
jgi:S-adenosylmethionine:tRNA ribosyltransferase-isomerase